MRRELRAELRSRFNALLVPISFRQKGFTWNRQVGEFIDVIDIQFGKMDTQEEYDFTVNCGVVWPPAFIASWDRPVPAFVWEPECTVRSRLGRLIDGKDFWWRSGQASDEEMAGEVTAKTEVYALPFINELHTLDAIERALGQKERHLRYPPEAISLAEVRKALGDIDGARRVLSSLIDRPLRSAWDERLVRLRQQLDHGDTTNA